MTGWSGLTSLVAKDGSRGKPGQKVGMAGKSIPEFGRTPLASRFGLEAAHG
jgi:hypothetical protein